MLNETPHPSLRDAALRAPLPRSLGDRLRRIPLEAERLAPLPRAPLPAALRARLRGIPPRPGTAPATLLRSPLELLAASVLLALAVSLVWNEPSRSLLPDAEAIEHGSSDLATATSDRLRDWTTTASARLSHHTRQTFDLGRQLAGSLTAAPDETDEETPGDPR